MLSQRRKGNKHWSRRLRTQDEKFAVRAMFHISGNLITSRFLFHRWTMSKTVFFPLRKPVITVVFFFFFGSFALLLPRFSGCFAMFQRHYSPVRVSNYETETAQKDGFGNLTAEDAVTLGALETQKKKKRGNNAEFRGRRIHEKLVWAELWIDDAFLMTCVWLMHASKSVLKTL